MNTLIIHKMAESYWTIVDLSNIEQAQVFVIHGEEYTANGPMYHYMEMENCYLSDRLEYLTSGVPQNVVVVASGSRPSLHKPKSVRTMWPWDKPQSQITIISLSPKQLFLCAEGEHMSIKIGSYLSI